MAFADFLVTSTTQEVIGNFGRDRLLSAAVFAQRMAELGDDGLAELGEDDVDGEQRGAQLEQVSAVVASGGERPDLSRGEESPVDRSG